MMAACEKVLGSNDHMHTLIKGKRTRRQRPPSSPMLSTASSSSSTEEGDGSTDSGGDNSGGYRVVATLSSTTSAKLTEGSSMGEEEDMANCLILLARGNRTQKTSKQPVVVAAAATAAATTNAARLRSYECHTCNKCFPSFQALGGHRASHRKPKAVAEDTKTSLFRNKGGDESKSYTTALSLQIGNRNSCSNIHNNKTRVKVHECWHCGAGFSSGQALGGHMRRHRTLVEATEAKKPRNLLCLDLNLPAPEDDRRESKFPFAPKDPNLVFTASSLVDCHY
ncbi:zinc finger protein ZAT5-like [Malania oleifera]|uniref:zinc finger protein ZAT5-like n=1 Tax=Malania oleifera TaxID=397392 RepID=UPI0025AE9B40|nr:zinc finger protein ZAT5-like [Malania oleifera]